MLFCYIAIVFDEESIEFYPPRSRFSRKDFAFNHSPQLDFEIFRHGTKREAKAEYIRGIHTAKDLMGKTDLTKAQLEKFDEVFSETGHFSDLYTT